MTTLSLDQFVKQAGGTTKDVQVLPANNSIATTPISDTAVNNLKSSSLFSPLTTEFGGGEQGIAQKLKRDIQGGADSLQNTKNPFSAGADLALAGGRVAGDVAGAIYTPVSTALNVVTGGYLGKFFDFVGKVSQMGGKYNPINAITDLKSVQDFVGKNPHLEEDFNRALNIGLASAESGKIEPSTIIPRTIEQLKSTVDTVGAIPETAKGKVIDYIKTKEEPAISSLENDYEKWTGQTKTGVKNLGKADARTEALNNAGTTGKTPQRVLAESKIIPETQGTKFRTFDQAQKFRDSLQPLNDANASALKEVDLASPPNSIADLEAKTIESIKSVKKPAGEIQSMINDAKNEYSLLKEKYGDTISNTDLNLEKQNYAKGVNFDSTKPLQGSVYEQIRRTAQKTIENSASKAGFEDVAQLNREIGDRLNAADFLQKLDGQTLKYGKIGKYAFMGIGASLGKGLVGKVFGAIGGEYVAELLMRADVATPVKRLILKNIKETNPEAYTATLDWLKQQGLDRELRLALPAPDYIPMGAGMDKSGTISAKNQTPEELLGAQKATGTQFPQLPSRASPIRLPGKK